MAVVKTKRNMVIAFEPCADDAFVETWVGVPEAVDGKNRRLLGTQPIAAYDRALAWAVGIADQMAFPISLVPITGGEYLDMNRTKIFRAFDRMTPRQRDEMQTLAVSTCAELMRDSDDPAIRAQAYETLQNLGVIE